MPEPTSSLQAEISGLVAAQARGRSLARIIARQRRPGKRRASAEIKEKLAKKACVTAEDVEKIKAIILQFPGSVAKYILLNGSYNQAMDEYNDPEDICYHLQRWDTNTQSHHPLWKNVLCKWMGNHQTWEQAKGNEGKMPYFHGTTEWTALQYIVPQSTPPETMVKTFAKADLAWVLVGGDPTPFWEGALLDNSSWRARNMLAPRYHGAEVVPIKSGDGEKFIAMLKRVPWDQLNMRLADLKDGEVDRNWGVPEEDLQDGPRASEDDEEDEFPAFQGPVSQIDLDRAEVSASESRQASLRQDGRLVIRLNRILLLWVGTIVCINHKQVHDYGFSPGTSMPEWDG